MSIQQNFETIDKSRLTVDGKKTKWLYARVSKLLNEPNHYTVQLFRDQSMNITMLLVAHIYDELEALNFFMSLVEPEDFPPEQYGLTKCTKYRASQTYKNLELLKECHLQIQGVNC